MASWSPLEFLELLIPSPEADPKIQYAWRKAVFLSLAGIMLIGSFSLAWAQGFVPGMSGVALSSDVASFKAAWNDDRADTTESNILDMHDRECLAKFSGNRQEAEFLARRVSELKNKYAAIKNRQYPDLEPCAGQERQMRNR
jgi:hypothetical protein